MRAALIALGGWGTLLHLPLWLVVGPFLVVGLALAAAGLVRTEWRPEAGPVVIVAALTSPVRMSERLRATAFALRFAYWSKSDIARDLVESVRGPRPMNV